MMRTFGTEAQREVGARVEVEVAVVVVGRDVQLMRSRPARRPSGLGEAVPGTSTIDHVHRPRLEERPVAAEPVEVLARADRHRRLVLDLAERVRVVHVDLHPHEVQARERAADADRGLRLHVEVEIERNADVGADRLPEGAEERLDVADHLGGHGLVRGPRPAPEPREVDPRRAARVNDVGGRPMASADDLLAEPARRPSWRGVARR
jgi:hypothetical protein